MNIKNLSVFFILLISFHFSLCTINVSNLYFEDRTITMDNLRNSEYYFHLYPSSDSKLNLPNYIKIVVSTNDYIDYINSYIISYYHNDNNFKNRKQISMSKPLIPPSTYMWLNQEQIKDGFYFKVEVQDNNTLFSIYQIDIMKYDYIYLDKENPNYKYYVTEENAQMSFLIKAEKDFFQNDNNAIIIWVDGNKKISVDINASDYIKHSKYNAYIIYNIKEYKEYILTVKASIGDSIDVGFLLVRKKVFYEDLSYYGDIIKIFLKKNILEEICFDDLNSKNIKFIDDINTKIPIYRECIKLPDEIDELFFYNHCLYYFGYPLIKNHQNIILY